jgi:hypothetical protein
VISYLKMESNLTFWRLSVSCYLYAHLEGWRSVGCTQTMPQDSEMCIYIYITNGRCITDHINTMVKETAKKTLVAKSIFIWVTD